MASVRLMGHVARLGFALVVVVASAKPQKIMRHEAREAMVIAQSESDLGASDSYGMHMASDGSVAYLDSLEEFPTLPYLDEHAPATLAELQSVDVDIDIDDDTETNVATADSSDGAEAVRTQPTAGNVPTGNRAADEVTEPGHPSDRSLKPKDLAAYEAAKAKCGAHDEACLKAARDALDVVHQAEEVKAHAKEVKGLVDADLVPVADFVSQQPHDGDCRWSTKMPGAVLGKGAHTVAMIIDKPGNYDNTRQWLLHMGQTGVGALHFCWNGGKAIQIGPWAGTENSASFSKLNGEINKKDLVLVESYDGMGKLTVFAEGIKLGTVDATYDIKNNDLKIGQHAVSGEMDFQGCIREVRIFREQLKEESLAGLIRDMKNPINSKSNTLKEAGYR